MKLFIILLIISIAFSFSLNDAENTFKNLQSHILKEQQCVYRPVTCPYSSGFSLPQCFTHPSGALGHWDVCVTEDAKMFGGEFTYHINYPSAIVKIEEQKVTNCDKPVIDGTNFSVHCKCGGHCQINGWWKIWF